MVYAVVRAGGRQEKVEVGTILTIDRAKADDKGNIDLAPCSSWTVTPSPLRPPSSRT